MSAFDEINKKEFTKRTILEKVICWFAEYDSDEYPITKIPKEAKEAAADLARLHKQVEAGERLAKRLRSLRTFVGEIKSRGDSVGGGAIFTYDDEAALKEWEEASE